MSFSVLHCVKTVKREWRRKRGKLGRKGERGKSEIWERTVIRMGGSVGLSPCPGKYFSLD